MPSLALTGARVFTGDEFLDHHAVVLSDRQVEQVCPANSIGDDVQQLTLDGGTVAPGFVDLQVNGGGGVMFNNSPTVQCLQSMLDAHRRGGTTALLPTLVSDSPTIHAQGLEAVRHAIEHGLESVLGVHFEGPFLSQDRRGVHREDKIRTLTIEDIEWLKMAAANCRLMLTLAPEHAKSSQISDLTDVGIVVCGGHTAANYQETMAAIAEGMSGFTHLFNAMSPLGSREPGAVGAALTDPDSWCGIIADGHHVHPATIRLAWGAKTKGKLYLVTDAMATVGSATTSFELYGETIQETDGRLVNREGRLAGSAISMIDAVRFTCETVDIALDECLRMASLYPAQFIGESKRRGRIASGFRADMVHFSDGFDVLNTWVAGDRKSHSELSSA